MRRNEAIDELMLMMNLTVPQLQAVRLAVEALKEKVFEIKKSEADCNTEFWISDDKVVLIRDEEPMVIPYKSIPKVSRNIQVEGVRLELMSIYYEKTGIPQPLEEKNAEARSKNMTYGKLQAQKTLELIRKGEL